MTTKEQFEIWWKRIEAGCPLTDAYELGVVKAHAEKAFYAGIRHNKRSR